MKTFVLALLACLNSYALFAQINTDSVVYELQRKKINGMLDERSRKFGEYDESLSKHTGIFGLQTKKDIRRSNEILMDITETDNQIFKQIKVLLDYRMFEQKQVETKKNEVETTNLNYMRTINRLREQNAKLMQEADEREKSIGKERNKYIIAIAVLIITSILLAFTRKRTVKP
ncbi:hypothetical protein [Mucilaginibacter aquatilis]|uniref:Uncharacterized protein n=1 Tax=Mucilaginibacter aquatilis TaxID=1517760 RepID=A0A6I4I4F9_9SPHI|nr:hypothetical protein [Mucilaginibacter aquatilis]MVN89657.1 hypothetical protein [Mucilaginibacter aquatilis]